jgi:hypothetical protein
MLTSRTVACLTLALAVGLSTLPGCGKKEDGGGGGGSSGGGGGSPAGPLGMTKANPGPFQKSRRNLMQIGLGLHNLHDANGYLSVGYCGPDRKSVGLSWRVAILPYIEEAPLYKQFKLDEPWDSEHNKKLIAKMPAIYAPPGDRGQPGHTYYRAFTGKDAVFTTQFPATPGQLVRGRSLAHITDGTTNTVMVAEAAEAVIWTKPDELVFDPKGPLPRLGGIFREGANLLRGDGTVIFLGDTSPTILKALITASGGETITLPGD